jgi:hypothetical protein
LNLILTILVALIGSFVDDFSLRSHVIVSSTPLIQQSVGLLDVSGIFWGI